MDSYRVSLHWAFFVALKTKRNNYDILGNNASNDIATQCGIIYVSALVNIIIKEKRWVSLVSEKQKNTH